MRKILFIAFLLVLMMPAISNAQGCAICSKTAAGLGEKSAKGLNSGIIYLALFPLTIIGTIGILWWKNNKAE